MLLSLRALKSLNSIEKILLRMMCASFNSDLYTKSSLDSSDEKDRTTFYNELSSLVRSIPKYNVLIIRGDMNKHKQN